jgi:hypothetical protein
VAGIIPAIKANARMDEITIELILEFITAFTLYYYIIIEVINFANNLLFSLYTIIIIIIKVIT